jgi:hypothetical protein
MLAVVIVLVTLHTVDGRTVDINPAQVTALSEARDEGSGYTERVNCVVALTGGKFITVTETCAMMRDLIHALC